MKGLTTSGAWIEQPDGGRVPLAGNCAVGRSSSNTLVIADSRVSRHHATIHAQDAGEFWLIDLGSINGTLRNGQRVTQPVQLRDGDRITIAETTFAFRQNENPAREETGTTTATVREVRQERRWLVLADMEGFTPLSQRLAPEELAKVVGQWLTAGREGVERHGVTMNKYTGDGWLACWPDRDGSAAQVAAAVRALRAQLEGGGPRFRVVVHCGSVSMGGAVGTGEEYLLGPEVNFTFRMEKFAGGAGAAFCFSIAAWVLLRRHLRLARIAGKHVLKGFPGSYEFFELRRE